MYMFLLPPPHEQDVSQGQFVKRSITGLNSQFSFYSTEVKENIFSNYLSIAGKRIVGFISFSRVLYHIC